MRLGNDVIDLSLGQIARVMADCLRQFGGVDAHRSAARDRDHAMRPVKHADAFGDELRPQRLAPRLQAVNLLRNVEKLIHRIDVSAHDALAANHLAQT